MDNRIIRGQQMLSSGIKPTLITQKIFIVPSQTSNRRYMVSRTDYGWICQCPDNKFRKVDCKHIALLKLWLQFRKKIEAKSELPLLDYESVCIYCKSKDIIKYGSLKNHYTIRQRFYCKSCKHTFVQNHEFNRIKADPKVVTLVLDLYFKGLSLRDIADTIKQFYQVKIHHSTIYRWIERFTKLANEYVDLLQPKLSETWHADEQMIKVNGKYVWNWNVLDGGTRFLIASNVTNGRDIRDARKVFEKSKFVANSKPEEIITDGLYSYRKAIRKEFGRDSNHIKLKSITKQPNNNLIERYHSTFRERDKVMRGFKISNSPAINGFRTYYNFIRPHSNLMGLTPSQIAGIDLNLGENRWLGLIRKSCTEKPIKIFPKKIIYTIEIFKDGKRFEGNSGLRLKFSKREKAMEHLQRYRELFTEYQFELKETELY